MLSRRLSEFAVKPFSALQAFISNPLLNYSRAPLNVPREDAKAESDHSRQNSSEQEENSSYNQQNGHNYNYRAKSLHFASLFPLFAIMTHKLNNVSCLFGSKPEKNKLTNRVALIQYPSNNPIEDRWAVQQLENFPGFVAMVFDGHGGWQVADYARENLPIEIDNALKANKGKKFANEDEYIITSIREAFDKVEHDFLQIAKEAYTFGFPDTGKVGACTLVTLVTGNKVYSANAGDCQGVLCKNDKGKITIKKINHKLNANSKKEQKRLKQQFSDDDIVVCKGGDSKACYVKNRLQPTRAFGDFTLKYPEFNNPKDLGIDQGYRMQIPNFKGPYITHQPEIQVFDIEKTDKYLILSSDGMWDELSRDDVAKFVEKNLNDKQKLTTELLNTSIQTAAKKLNMSEGEIRRIPIGQRRRYHDDITIVVVDLENQSK